MRYIILCLHMVAVSLQPFGLVIADVRAYMAQQQCIVLYDLLYYS